MRNVVVCVLWSFSVTGLLFAESSYQPPAGGDRLFLYGHPQFITSANSAAGGPLYTEGSFSINMNPALSAGLECPSADIGYTALPQTAGINAAYSQALHFGMSFPTRRGVLTGGIQGLSAKSGELPYGNLAIFRFGWARDVIEKKLYLGFLATGGLVSYDSASDFCLAGDVGLWYRIGDFAFLKDTRLGFALQNVGKTFGTNGPTKFSNVTGFPGGIITPKAGVAASLVEVEHKFALGVSADVSLPSVTNLLFNTGLQAAIAEVVYISAGWDFNIRETADYNQAVHSPYVGIGVKFRMNTSGSETMKKRGFNETTLDIDGVWQKLHQDVHLISIGVSASFGVKDQIPPDISIGEIKYTE